MKCHSQIDMMQHTKMRCMCCTLGPQGVISWLPHHLTDGQQRSQQHEVDGILVDADRLQDEVLHGTRQRDDLQPAHLR